MAEVRGTNNNDLLEGTIDNDDVFGYKGKDKAFGGGGDDFIVGHEGKDGLTGGAGADEFVFAFKSDLKSKNVDKILDFNPAEGDTILLSYKVFKHMGFGPLKAEFFHVGKKAADKDDHIIYDDKKHALFYDSDGKGGDDQVKFAGFTYDVPFIGSGSVDPIVSMFLTSFLETDVGLPL